jgi:hypothetical protein
MIKKHSDDPNVEHAATQALSIIKTVLESLPPASSFDYGGHTLKIGEYDVCATCTKPIAEAQQANDALLKQAGEIDDATVKEHVEVAAQLFRTEAEAAVIRAELHNGFGTEKILNFILGFQYEHDIHDDYHHSHKNGN